MDGLIFMFQMMVNFCMLPTEAATTTLQFIVLMKKDYFILLHCNQPTEKLQETLP